MPNLQFCRSLSKEGIREMHLRSKNRLASAKALSTVGCGDFLLGGFLKGLKDKSDAGSALRTAIKVATARAWGWTESKTWPQVQRGVGAKIEEI